jgi:hypothetical protein
MDKPTYAQLEDALRSVLPYAESRENELYAKWIYLRGGNLESPAKEDWDKAHEATLRSYRLLKAIDAAEAP